MKVKVTQKGEMMGLIEVIENFGKMDKFAVRKILEACSWLWWDVQDVVLNTQFFLKKRC